MSDTYSADQVIDKFLKTTKALPYYANVPDGSYTAKQLGTWPAGTYAGRVFSWIDADPAKGRPDLWWMFYPDSNGVYTYMPHRSGDFDIQSLRDQGALSDQELNNPDTWYEKVLKMALPVIAIAIVGGAAIRGYFSRGK